MSMGKIAGLSNIKTTLLPIICCLFMIAPPAYGGCIDGDCRNGQGTFTETNGNQYAGEFKDGKYSGQGTLTWVNGDKFSGSWVDGKRIGQGTHIWSDGTRYVGGWKDSKRTGQGTITWANGGRYVGGWKDDKFNGQGTITWADGGRYAGEFKDGQLSGQGTRTWNDGEKYIGEFKDGQLSGQGTLAWADGVVYEGNFVDGTPRPPYNLLFSDGARHSGTVARVVKIVGTVENSQARSIGLQKGDTIVEYNKDAVLNAAMLLHLISQTRPPENVNIVVRRQGKDLTFPLKGGRIGAAIQDHYAYALEKEDLKVAADASGQTVEADGGGKGNVSKPGLSSKSPFGRYHALVIGNNNYQSFPKLKTARNDAQTVANILKNHYGFKVTLLLDARRSDVLGTLVQLREELTGQDSLLIYYAGHGYLDKEGDEGYWLPVDATKKNEVNWISNASITTQLKAMEAKHVLIIADSCYSGKLGRGVHIQQRTPDYYSRIAQKRSRSVIASGGLEPVIDSGGKGNHSVFASALIDALQENTNVIDGAGLFNKIRRPVVVNADQNPEYSDIRKAGHDGGEFIFIRKK